MIVPLRVKIVFHILIFFIQEAMIFGEEVAKTLLQLLMEYFNSEDYEYWLFGWLTGNIIMKEENK